MWKMCGFAALSYVQHDKRRKIPAEPVFVNVYGAQEPMPLAYIAWRAGTTYRVVVLVRQAGNRFLSSLKVYKYGLRTFLLGAL
jgi:hypothetical protein